MLRNCAIFTILFFSSTLSWGQKTVQYENPNALFNSAVDLYDNDVYNACIKKFGNYLELNPTAYNRVDAHFYIAVSKLKLQHSNALLEALELLKAYPENRKTNELNLAIASTYLAKEKFRQAARHLKEVDINSLPAEAKDEFAFNRAYSYFKSKKYKEAAIEFQPLTTSENPYFIKSNYYYGYALYQEKNYDAALKAFKRIENRGPQTMKLYVAQIYYLKGLYKQSIDEANSISLPSLKPKGQMMVGKSYYKIKQYEKAVIAFERAEINPEVLSETEQYEVGYAYYKAKKYSKAFDYLSPIANKDNELGQLASYNLGHCFLFQNKKQNALNAFYEAQRKNHSSKVKEEALFQYAKLSYDMNNSINATSAFQAFLYDFPNSEHADEAKNILVSLFVNTNDYKTALSLLNGIKKWDANTEKLYQQISFSRGQELINAVEYPQAKASFQNSLKYPVNKEKEAASHFWLGEIAIRTQNNNEAKKAYEIFIAKPISKSLSYFPSAHYSLGYIYYKEENYTKASMYFSQVTELKTSYSIEENKLNDNHLRLGDCNYILKNYPIALNAYSYTTSANRPESDYALFQQGMIYGLNNQATEKIQVMKRIPRDFPHSIYIPDAIFELASEQMQIENYKESERNFQYLILDFPSSTYKRRVYLSLGLIYYNSSQDKKALTEFKNVVKEFPGSPEAKNAASFIEKIYIDNGESQNYLAWLETLPNNSVSASYKDSISYDAAQKRFMKGDYSVSLNDFENYIKNYPKGFFILEAHHLALYCARETNEEEKEINHLIALSTGNTNKYTEEALWDLASIYIKNDECIKSIPYLERAEKITKSIDKIKESQFFQVLCYEENKDTSKMEALALKLFGQKVLTPNQEGKILTILAEKELRENNLDQSYLLFKQAREKFTNQHGAKSLYYMALIDFNKDKLDDSKAKILEFGEDFSSYDYWFGKCFILLSDIYVKREDNFQAKATLNSVIDNFEHLEIIEEAKSKLAKLLEEEKEKKQNLMNPDEDTIEDVRE